MGRCTLAELASLPDISSKATIMARVADNMFVTAHESEANNFLWDLSSRSSPKFINKLQSRAANPDGSIRCAHRIVALEGGLFATAHCSVPDDSWFRIRNETGAVTTQIESQDRDKLGDMLFIRVSDCPCLVTCHELTERFRKICLVSVRGASFYMWMLVEAAYKKSIVLPAAN
jgi:hypothetical protein